MYCNFSLVRKRHLDLSLRVTEDREGQPLVRPVEGVGELQIIFYLCHVSVELIQEALRYQDLNKINGC